MKKDKYIFIDRDGVIIHDKHYLYKISDMEFLPRAIDGLKKIQDLGYQFIIISNQAGIARKIFTEQGARLFNKELMKRLKKYGILIAACYFCPHHPEYTGECSCRKPKTGMVEEAKKNFKLTPSESIFIGDKDCDIELGKNCDGVTILIQNNQYEITAKPNFIVHNLIEAADILQTLT